MKTLDFLAVATLLLLSIGTFANTSGDRDGFAKLTKQVVLPDPQDVNFEEVEALKEIGSSLNAPKAAFPAIATPDAEDFNATDIENLKNIEKTTGLPKVIVGYPQDINLDDIEALKVL